LAEEGYEGKVDEEKECRVEACECVRFLQRWAGFFWSRKSNMITKTGAEKDDLQGSSLLVGTAMLKKRRRIQSRRRAPLASIERLLVP